jgi:hypothetical protein
MTYTQEILVIRRERQERRWAFLSHQQRRIPTLVFRSNQESSTAPKEEHAPARAFQVRLSVGHVQALCRLARNWASRIPDRGAV